MYLDIRDLGKLFLRSSYHFLFKNVDVDGLDGNLCGHLLLEHCFALLTKHNYVGDSYMSSSAVLIKYILSILGSNIQSVCVRVRETMVAW